MPRITPEGLRAEALVAEAVSVLGPCCTTDIAIAQDCIYSRTYQALQRLERRGLVRRWVGRGSHDLMWTATRRLTSKRLSEIQRRAGAH